MKFRSKSLFTTCEVCSVLKQQLADRSLGVEAKLTALQQYRAHLHSQYADRTSMWQLQSQSSEPNCEVLFIATDGLDQAKFALPRHPDLKANAAVCFGHGFINFSVDIDHICVVLWGFVFTLVMHLTCHCYPLLRGRHERPRLKVHGAWAFGHYLNIYLMDDVAKHDSSSVIEMISRTLEDVACQHEKIISPSYSCSTTNIMGVFLNLQSYTYINES